MSYCPYCEKPLQRAQPDSFDACPGCGYRSAQISSADGECLIIDSKLPDIMSRYRQLMAADKRRLVVIDRRVGHNHIAGVERRREPA